MANLKEVLTMLRDKFVDEVSVNDDVALAAYDRALSATLLEFIDGNGITPESPKKRPYVRKPKVRSIPNEDGAL